MNCPKCKSKNTKQVKYQGIDCIVCKDCGYDERDKYEVFDSSRVSQKQKGRYSPYKTGGGKRSN